MEQRLIDANALNRKNVNCANFPMNFIDIAPTVLTIPENPTNGDVIKAIFKFKSIGNTNINNNHNHIISDLNGDFYVRVSDSWWNAPYKKES